MIVVAGSNRSGTSCVSGILQKLGISMGRGFLPADKNNKSGYWEDKKLRRYLRNTFGMGSVPNNTFEARVEWFKAWAQTRTETAIVGCKYPALCFTLHEMTMVWDDLRVVCTDRPEADIRESLKIAGWNNNRRCSPHEYPTRRDAALNNLPIPRMHVDFSTVLENPEQVVDQLIQFCGITPTDQQRADAISHVQPKLCHVTTTPASPQEPVDVVVPLSNGSKWNDNELRYMLRSLEKYAVNLGRVVIVGRKPSWVTGVTHIPMGDRHRRNKDANIIDKVRRAISQGVSRRFVFASDDQFLVSPLDLATFPATRGRQELNSQTSSKWWERVKNTTDYLSSQGKPTVFYDTHLFQPYIAEQFEKAVADAPYKDGIGMTINTLAMNGCQDVRSVPSGELRGFVMRGYGDDALADPNGLKKLFADKFPSPSRYELPDENVSAPRVFTFWTGPRPPIIDMCLRSIEKNIPGSECWTLERWKAVYDGKFGPWSNIAHRRPNVQSDYLRYWLLSTYGGIWLDADYIAFGDIRPVWDTAADYVGYLVHRRKEMPYTAMMAAQPGSPIVAKQCEIATQLLSNRRIGMKAGPRCTLSALRACPDANVVWIKKDRLHPIRWHQWIHNPVEQEFQFPQDSYGMMLVHQVVDKYRGMTEEQILADKTIVGQAFRKSLL